VIEEPAGGDRRRRIAMARLIGERRKHGFELAEISEPARDTVLTVVPCR
jgi:hypothetical protein